MSLKYAIEECSQLLKDLDDADEKYSKAEFGSSEDYLSALEHAENIRKYIIFDCLEWEEDSHTPPSSLERRASHKRKQYGI